MSLKVKLTSTICAFVLILGLMVMGVFASSTATVNLGGSLSFSANNVHARVAGAVSGAENSASVNLPELTFMEGRSDAEKDSHEDDVDAWGQAGLQYNENGDDIVIVLTIENLATDRPLYATVKTSTNMSSAVDSEMLIVESPTAETGTEYTGAPITLQQQDTSNTDDIVYIRLTISLKDKNTSLPADAKWGYDIELKDEASMNVNNISNLSFTVLDESAKTASVSMKSIEATSGNIVIPSYVIINPVSGEATMATADTSSSNLYKVTDIPEYAFLDFELFRGFITGTIPIPDGVETEDELYALCYASIENLTIPETIESIGEKAFGGYVEKVTIKRFPINFSSDSFNSVLTKELIIESGIIETIKFKSVEKITIGNGVTEIGSSAFSGCSGLTSIEIPSSVTSIGNNAFQGSGLTSIEIPSSVTSIGDSAFNGCDNLTSVTIPSGVETIGDSAFFSCSGLTSVEIPDSVTSIGESAFSGCSGLTSIEIPGSVTSIGSSAFSGCSRLESITVLSGNSIYQDRSLNAIVEKETNTIIAGCKNTTIDNTITAIGSSAFSGCSGLTSIEIPSSVTSIGNNAFQGSGLTSIEIPSSVTSIGNYAFQGSGLASIEIPSSVTSIGDRVFFSCSGLTSVEIPDSVTSIGDSAFSGCSGLTSIEIPDSVTSIGNYAFQSSGLASVVVEKIPASLGVSIFNNCTKLETVTIENGTATDMFRGITAIKTIILGEGVTSIGSSAFYGCSGLTSVTIPSGVETIGDSAFYNCSGLTSIEIPGSVTSIEIYAFSGCTNLTTLTVKATTPPTMTASSLPSSITKIYVPTGSKSAYTTKSHWRKFDASVFEEKTF